MIAARLFRASDKGLMRASLPRLGAACRLPTSAWRLLLGALVPVMLALGLLAPASALGAAPPVVSVAVAFRAPPDATIGSEVMVAATVRRADHAAPTGVRVGLYANGKYLSSAHADSSGNLAFRVSGAATSTAGTLNLEARFDGARGLAPARASVKLKIRPAVVTIATVPVVSGIPISIGDATATTGPDGTATISVAKVGPVSLEAHLDVVAADSVRVSFIRWGDQVYDLRRDITVRGDATFVLGLRTAYRAGVRFIDQSGTPVDPVNISRARFTSSTGGELVLTSFDGAWWEAGTAVSRTGGLQPSSTLWRLSEVEMAGTNVVNQGQQAFNPSVNGTWTINLLLFDLAVRTDDALTGGSLPGTAQLVFPDSTSRDASIAADGTATFRGLPRGSYLVKLKTDGIAPPTPIALSRSQDVTIRVISYLDIGAAVGLALLVLVALLWIGRRRQLRWLMRASAVPGAVARNLPLGSAASMARRGLPAAKSTVSTVPSDLAAIDHGRGAAAFAFGRLFAARLVQVIVALLVRVIRMAVGAMRRARRAVAGSFGRSADQAAANRATARGGRGLDRRVAAGDGAPAWPATSLDVLPPIHPPVIVRPAQSDPQSIRKDSGPASGGQGWFDAGVDDEGPTHECRMCHRQVPDGARFCRSCGHLQE